MPQHPSIAIVGGGPAGLVAANILHRHGWPVTVFEADAAPSARDQGGTLDLHPDDGQLALAKAGLLDAFLSVARHEDQEERVRDHATGALLREVIPDAGTGERPEIDRLHLRQLLLQPLGNEVVRWGERVEEAIAHPDGRHDLRLRERTVGPFDLVIGADGASSRVRTTLSDVRPAYTGVTFVELWLSEVDERHPALAKLVGHGTMFSLHNEAGIFAQRNGEATIRVYAAFRTLAEGTDRPDKALAGITTAEILARFEGWSPSLLALIVEADLIAAIRPIMALPAGFRWEHRHGMTLVGDAAHVMPPMGEGVNLAMLDAAELAEALVGAEDWQQAVEASETDMIERASEVARECHQGFAEWFSAEGGKTLLEHLDHRQAQERTA